MNEEKPAPPVMWKLLTSVLGEELYKHLPTCQPPKDKKCEILKLELGKVVRNELKVVRCPNFPSGRSSSGDYGY